MSRTNRAKARPVRRTPIDRLGELDRVYAELPAIECKGKCADSCGNINMTRLEQDRIARAGFTIERRSMADTPGICPALTMFNRCAVYEIRPLICRLWGLYRPWRCSYGCIPEGGYLTDQHVVSIIARTFALAGESELAGLAASVIDDPRRLAAWIAMQRDAGDIRETNEIRGCR